MRNGIVVAVLIIMLFTPAVGAMKVSLYSVCPVRSSQGHLSAYFEDGFWILNYQDYKNQVFWTRLINASTNRTVFYSNNIAGPFSFFNNGKGMVVFSGNSVGMYKLSGGDFQLVWETPIDSKYGWVSAISVYPSKNLILLGTTGGVDGHYVIGLSMNGELRFETKLNVKGGAVSNILSAGDGRYLIIIPGPVGASFYFGLIDGSGNLLASEKRGKFTEGRVYLEGNFVMAPWHNKGSGYLNEIKTVWGIWTRSLVPVVFINTSYQYLDATPVFDGNSLYLFTVADYFGKNPVLRESKYSPSGELMWVKNLTTLWPYIPLYNFTDNGPKMYPVMPSVIPVLMPYSNVYVGIYMLGKTLKVVAVDFRDGVLLSNVSVDIPGLNGEEIDLSYNNNYISVNNYTYRLDFKDIPSVLQVDSSPKAQVFVDGKAFGQTPLTIKVAPGTHIIKVLRKGYTPFIENISVEPHTGYRVFANLSLMNGTLILNSTPSAEVYINPIGKIVNTPAGVSLRNGTYVLSFSARRYTSQYGNVSRHIEIGPNETINVSVNLPLLKSNITVVSNVENSTVYLDGKPVGNSPLSLLVPVGVHNITVKAPGYVPYSLRINAIKPTMNISVTLKASPQTSCSSSASSATITRSTPIITQSSTVSSSSTSASRSLCGPGLVVLLSLSALCLWRKRES